jgi:hypothetical protein
MYRLALKKLALGVGLLVGLVCAVSACGGTEQQVSKPQPLPEEEQELRPGEYRSEEFEPSLSFRVGEGWTSLPPETSDSLFIARGETAALVDFLNVQEVY